MHVFKHPKYYTELRKRNREVLRSGRGLAVNQAPHVSDQAISSPDSREVVDSVRSGPGLKSQASSGKPQAASLEKQASSPEEQASSRKP